MKLLLLILLAVAAFGQASNYPAALDTDTSLFVTRDFCQSTLSTAVGTSETTWTVASGSCFAANMIVTVCDTSVTSGVMAGKCTAWEHAKVTGVAGNDLTVTRGVAGTSARSHAAGKAVSVAPKSAEREVLVDAVKKIETALGANLSNLGTVQSTRYAFTAQTPGGSLINGANAITMTPVPAGVNGTDSNHYLYVSGGTGTAEACLISGGSGTAGSASGTIIITCAGTHSGAWTIQSATAGIQEALQSLVTAGNGGRVYVPQGSHDIYAPVRVNGTGYWIEGAGLHASIIKMRDTGSTNAFEFISSGTGHFNGISDIGIFGVDGTVPTLKSGGAAVKLTNQAYFTGRNLYIYAYPNAINTKDSGFQFYDVHAREVKPTTGVGFYQDGGGAFDNIINHFTLDASAAYFAGINIVSTGYTAVDRADVVHANYGFLLNPGNGQFVNTVDVIGSYFDGSYIHGIHIEPAGTGMVTRVRFNSCWTASALESGVFVNGTGATVIDGVSFIGHYSPFNVQHGFFVSGATTKNVEIRDSFAFGNSASPSVAGTYDGISIAGGEGVKITHTVSRRYGDASDSQSRGLVIASGVTDLTVTGNDFSENVNGGILDQSTSTVKIIRDNAGVDDQTPPTIASAASIALPTTGARVVYISGTTQITTITGGAKNEEVTLIFTNAAPGGVGTGGNIARAQTAAQNQALRITFDGTNWY